MPFVKQKNGFTLAELTVVITIISILSLISIPTYYGSIKKARYEEAVTEIITLIKDTRNTSIIGSVSQSGAKLTTLQGGFGILIAKSGTGASLRSFQDTNENSVYNLGDREISTYILPEEILLKTMSGAKANDYNETDTTANFSGATILFKPPQGEAVLNENDAGKSLLDLFILLERYDGNKSKRLKINKISGFIETQ